MWDTSLDRSFNSPARRRTMAYDDEHADILGGPILQIPNTGILGQWSQYSILLRASLILALGLLVSLISLRAWDIWKKNQELGYRKYVILFTLR